MQLGSWFIQTFVKVMEKYIVEVQGESLLICLFKT